MWIMYSFLSLRLGTSFSTPLIFILSHINVRSLWESCSSVGYLTSTSSRYPLSVRADNLDISLGFTSTHLNPPVGRGYDIARLYKLFASRYCR